MCIMFGDDPFYKVNIRFGDVAGAVAKQQFDKDAVEGMYSGLSPEVQSRLNQVVEMIVAAKKRDGKMAAVVGSRPNLHEGVNTCTCQSAGSQVHRWIVGCFSWSEKVGRL